MFGKAGSTLMPMRYSGGAVGLLVCCVLVGAGANPEYLPDGIVISPKAVIRQNFSFRFLEALRLNETSRASAERMFREPPQSYLPTSVAPSPRKREVPRTEQVVGYRYVERGICSARKGVDLVFVNDRLQSYAAYSELSGEARTPISFRQIGQIHPGKTTRTEILSEFGLPDYWRTGLMLDQPTGPEEVGYTWISSSAPDLRRTRLIIKINERGIVLDAPKLNPPDDLPTSGWYCDGPPPVP